MSSGQLAVAEPPPLDWTTDEGQRRDKHDPPRLIQFNNPFSPPLPPESSAAAFAAAASHHHSTEQNSNQPSRDKMPSPSADFPFGSHRVPPASAGSSLSDTNPFAHHATLLNHHPEAHSAAAAAGNQQAERTTRDTLQEMHDFQSRLPPSTDPDFFKVPKRRPPSSSGSSAYPNPFSGHLNFIGESEEHHLQDEEQQEDEEPPKHEGSHAASPQGVAGWQQASNHGWQLTPETIGSPWQSYEATSPPQEHHSGWRDTDPTGLGVSAAPAGPGMWKDFCHGDSPALGEPGPSNWHHPSAGDAAGLSNGFGDYSFGGHNAAHRPATAQSGHQTDWRAWQPRPGTAKAQTPKYKPQTPKLAVKVARYIATPLGDDAPDLALNPYGRTADADRQWNEENAAEVDSDDEDLERFAWNRECSVGRWRLFESV